LLSCLCVLRIGSMGWGYVCWENMWVCLPWFFLLLYLCILVVVLGGRLLVLSSLFCLVSVELLRWWCAIFWGGIWFLRIHWLGSGWGVG
jgi:hypothetical protein